MELLLFALSFEGNAFSHQRKICSQETRDTRLSYGEHPEPLSHLGLIWYSVVTDRQTELP